MKKYITLLENNSKPKEVVVKPVKPKIEPEPTVHISESYESSPTIKRIVRNVMEKKSPEPPKPRNPVAKNANAAVGGGAAGKHKDKKKDAKQGVQKHKGQQLDEYFEKEKPTDGELLLLMKRYRLAKISGKPLASVMRQSDIHKLIDAEKDGRIEALKYRDSIEESKKPKKTAQEKLSAAVDKERKKNEPAARRAKQELDAAMPSKSLAEGRVCPQCGSSKCSCPPGKCKCKPVAGFKPKMKEDKDPCWKNYKMVGTKKKGSKTVPNCVPKESRMGEAQNAAQQAAIAIAKKKKKSVAEAYGAENIITPTADQLKQQYKDIGKIVPYMTSQGRSVDATKQDQDETNAYITKLKSRKDALAQQGKSAPAQWIQNDINRAQSIAGEKAKGNYYGEYNPDKIGVIQMGTELYNIMQDSDASHPGDESVSDWERIARALATPEGKDFFRRGEFAPALKAKLNPGLNGSKLVPPAAAPQEVQEAGFIDTTGWSGRAVQRLGHADDHGGDDSGPKVVAWWFYDVPAGQEEMAAALSIKQTKSGKWAMKQYDKSGRSFTHKKGIADEKFGPGKQWVPKNKGMAETQLDELDRPSGKLYIIITADNSGAPHVFGDFGSFPQDVMHKVSKRGTRDKSGTKTKLKIDFLFDDFKSTLQQLRTIFRDVDFIGAEAAEFIIKSSALRSDQGEDVKQLRDYIQAGDDRRMKMYQAPGDDEEEDEPTGGNILRIDPETGAARRVVGVKPQTQMGGKSTEQPDMTSYKFKDPRFAQQLRGMNMGFNIKGDTITVDQKQKAKLVSMLGDKFGQVFTGKELFKEGGDKYKIKSIGSDVDKESGERRDYYISPSTGKKVYKAGVKKGDHENPNSGDVKKQVEGKIARAIMKEFGLK